MMKKIISTLLLLNGILHFSNAQEVQVQHTQQADTLTSSQYLPDVTVVGRESRHDIQQMPEVVGTHIFAGKKNALVVIDNVNGNIVMNNMRQVLAKVPGIHIWESDGSGIQIGIATRGLSPNRSWDFNVRQNGYDISADPYGYPEAYYHPPLQAVQRVQIVKGAGSLQFGPQFGGMINYVIRNGSEINKRFSFETQQTTGSFGLINTYNAIGGKGKKSNYYAFFDHRDGDGWRENSRYKTNTAYATYNYQVNDKLKAGVDVLHYEMLSQQPGGLTDAQFAVDAKQSFRSRNWFNMDWTMASANLDYKVNDNNTLNLKVFGLKGDRNSVGYLGNISMPDTINTATLQYNNRTVDIDEYRNAGAELRYLSNYKLGKFFNTLTLGARYFHGSTHRLKNGKGDAGLGFNLDVLSPYPQLTDFKTDNVAFSVENIFRFGKRFIVIPGARFESITGKAAGRLNFNADGTENKIGEMTKGRTFILGALAAEYHIGKATEVYGNITQAYRPIQFADLTAAPTTDIIDPNLKDAKGYSADLGYRGKVKNYLMFDVDAFYLNYDNRIGSITQMRADNTTYNFRTNVGSSHSKGFEGLVEFNPFQAGWFGKKFGELSVFTSYSYTNAVYDNFKIITKDINNHLVETNLKNKKVENAPENIVRAGITYMYKTLAVTGQVSHVSKTFSDANNTVTPNAAGTVGLIPAYTIGDISLAWKFKENYNVKAGVNNFANAKYFTRRAGGYPGPGLMPADARGFFVSIGAKF
ncbi:MAG: Iron(III) dicitrate transport protein FecA [uncultured Segetibacter sp.]|uniref:Iron(III) dicitrate transport protein FecA n=1 Tax=uncultured Segetibacter sp. TaxID=481133 RepID=A0A6J4RWB2_9BACT|nr:MAG: Iron(III) dicitrate transport protein FecA [uncultured Segetibacter sp.]